MARQDTVAGQIESRGSTQRSAFIGGQYERGVINQHLSEPLLGAVDETPMNTDERGCFDSLTDQVLGAVFKVSNTLGTRALFAGFAS